MLVDVQVVGAVGRAGRATYDRFVGNAPVRRDGHILDGAAMRRAWDAIRHHNLVASVASSVTGDEGVVAVVSVHQKSEHPVVCRTRLVIHHHVPFAVIGLGGIDQLFRDKSDLAHVDRAIWRTLHSIEKHVNAGRRRLRVEPWLL